MQDLPPQKGRDSSPREKQVTLLYGTQTGNSAWLAEQYAARLSESGYTVTRCCMSRFPDIDLKEAKTLLVLISTFLNGEPPDAAAPFCKFLLGEGAPKLTHLRYSVLALGDVTYEGCFCTVGRQLDARLEQLGAMRIHPRVDCDVDFEDTAHAWFNGVMEALAGKRPPAEGETSGHPSGAGSPGRAAGRLADEASDTPPVPPTTDRSRTAVPAASKTAVYSRKNPFPAEVLENRNLNGPGSDRETRHLRLSLQGSDLSFAPGDSLGIYPTNHPRLVDELLDELGYGGDEIVSLGADECSIREALGRHCEITVATRGLQEQLYEWSAARPVDAGRDVERGPVAGRDLLDLVRDLSLREFPPRQLVSALRRLPPRLYSFANSPRMHADEAHVTISVLRYRAGGRDRYGVCSVECAERIQPGDRLPVYVNPNSYFHLPRNPDAPVIMVGPGTESRAPFRAFLQEREAIGAGGDNWLFFGARRRATDFLYQEDWQSWQRGLLTRLDAAFSRDTSQKIYVQHRMKEHGKELYAWLQRGACLYVAGDEKHMAPNVHRTVLEIAQREGGLDRRAAEDYLGNLQRERRYQRDLY